jgi:hypothetical protein
MKKLKNRKWYSTIKTIPDREFDLIIMTDMGYIFEATYQNGRFLTSVVRNGKVYFEPHFNQDSIVRFMKV